ncbi:zinc-dependent alcohol dehydrogenase family protein [Paenibacillus sp. P25]|nr:zinc-dependent alcohol dehydrogenase family protein [Paenibacillus sp. P25]
MEPWMIYCERFGEPAEVLTLKRREPPRPQAGEILVRMTASPINPSDLLPVRGAYAHRIALPFVPGYEGVGTVEDVGGGVSRSMIGTRVLPLRGEGTWQELVVSPAEWAVPVPASLEDATASQLYINPVTAWLLCTDVLRLGGGDVLAVNAGGSAIGRIFSQLSTLLGFRLISIVRSDRHTGELISLGAWRVVNTGETDLHDAVTEWTNGNGVTATVDCVGGRSGADLIACTQTRRRGDQHRSPLRGTLEFITVRTGGRGPFRVVSFEALAEPGYTGRMAEDVPHADPFARETATASLGDG